jgi:hypothetical protein
MGGKRVINNKNYATDADMGADFLGAAVDIEGVDRVSFQATFVGTPAGALIIQLSNDGVTWFDSNSTITAGADPAGAPGAALVEVETAAAFARLFFDYTSGAGTLQGHVVGKGWQ